MEQLSKRRRTVAIAGLGNVLLGDDGIGPLIVAQLQAGYDFPENVRLDDLGTPGINLQPWLADLEALIVIDALRSSQPVGSIEILDRDTLMSQPPPPRVSPHDLGLKESLLLAELAEGRTIPVFMVGISIAQTEQGAPMTGAVTQSVEPAIDAILDLLHAWGIHAQPADPPRASPVWWWQTPKTQSCHRSTPSPRSL